MKDSSFTFDVTVLFVPSARLGEFMELALEFGEVEISHPIPAHVSSDEALANHGNGVPKKKPQQYQRVTAEDRAKWPALPNRTQRPRVGLTGTDLELWKLRYWGNTEDWKARIPEDGLFEWQADYKNMKPAARQFRADMQAHGVVDYKDLVKLAKRRFQWWPREVACCIERGAIAVVTNGGS